MDAGAFGCIAVAIRMVPDGAEPPYVPSNLSKNNDSVPGID
jgi:hypothetical protein